MVEPVMALTREQLIAEAKIEHDKVCRCDPKYLRSCPRMAQAILDVGKRDRERSR